MKIVSIEVKEDKNGNSMKVLKIDDKTVFVNSKYNKAVYDVITAESEVELEKDGDFWKVKPESVGVEEKPKGGNFKTQQIEKAQDRKATQISSAQDRNERMWAKRSAFEMVAHHPAYKELAHDEILVKVKELTDRFILEF